MKIYRKLFAEIISIESLLAAWDAFKPGKRDKPDVQQFEYKLEDNLFQLHRDLAGKRYRHGPYHAFYIRDPKVRHIHKAEVRDRIVHHALCKHLSAIFEPTFIADSYSAQIAKGAHRAVRRLQTFARSVRQTHGQCFVLKCDIRKFFPSLDHAILREIIARRIKDPDALWLAECIVESFTSEFSKPGESKGAPIGNLTSQLFANIYMNEFDQFVKQELRVKRYIRYTDDFVILHQDVGYLRELKQIIGNFLETKLKLSLHPHKVQIRKYHQGIDFLGYVSLPHARVLRTKVKRRMFKKLHWRVRQFKDGMITEFEFMQSVSAYLGILIHANAYELEEELRHKLWEWLKEPA